MNRIRTNRHEGEHPSSSGMIYLRKFGLFATNQPILTPRSLPISLSYSARHGRRGCGNPLITAVAWRGNPRKDPTTSPEEASALVAATPSYQVRMATRIMLGTGLRVSECLSLTAVNQRLDKYPPIISLRPYVK